MCGTHLCMGAPTEVPVCTEPCACLLLSTSAPIWAYQSSTAVTLSLGKKSRASQLYYINAFCRREGLKVLCLIYLPLCISLCRPTGYFQYIMSPPLWVTHIFKIRLIWWQDKQIQKSKQNIFIFNVVAHVCPPLRLTNTDIRLVVCTAWVMWHQSDLQNSRGGAINHIGSGINHCVEDIFCHRCPLTITLCKTLAPSLLPSIPLFLHRSISHQSDHRLVSRGRKKREMSFPPLI